MSSPDFHGTGDEDDSSLETALDSFLCSPFPPVPWREPVVPYHPLQSPQSWHGRAKRKIRMEAGSLIVAAVVYSTSVVILELTHGGGSTPLLPFAVMVSSQRSARSHIRSWRCPAGNRRCIYQYVRAQGGRVRAHANRAPQHSLCFISAWCRYIRSGGIRPAGIQQARVLTCKRSGASAMLLVLLHVCAVRRFGFFSQGRVPFILLPD